MIAAAILAGVVVKRSNFSVAEVPPARLSLNPSMQKRHQIHAFCTCRINKIRRQRSQSPKHRHLHRWQSSKLAVFPGRKNLGYCRRTNAWQLFDPALTAGQSCACSPTIPDSPSWPLILPQRLAKWFTTLSPKEKAKIIKDVSQLVLARRTRMCNFLEYKGWLCHGFTDLLLKLLCQIRR